MLASKHDLRSERSTSHSTDSRCHPLLRLLRLHTTTLGSGAQPEETGSLALIRVDRTLDRDAIYVHETEEQMPMPITGSDSVSEYSDFPSSVDWLRHRKAAPGTPCFVAYPSDIRIFQLSTDFDLLPEASDEQTGTTAPSRRVPRGHKGYRRTGCLQRPPNGASTRKEPEYVFLSANSSRLVVHLRMTDADAGHSVIAKIRAPGNVRAIQVFRDPGPLKPPPLPY